MHLIWIFKIVLNKNNECLVLYIPIVLPLKHELRNLLPSFVNVNTLVFEHIINKQSANVSYLNDLSFENHEYNMDSMHLNGEGFKKLRGKY